MITSLTKEQEAQIPALIEKWVGKASMPIDRTKTVKIVKELFGDDKIVLVGESIQNACDIIRYICSEKKIKYSSQLDIQLDSQLYSQLDIQLDSQLYSQLDIQLDSQLYSQLDIQLDSQLRSQLSSQLHSQLSSQLHSQLDIQLDSQLRSQLDSQLGDDVQYAYYTALWWNVWLGYYDFAEFIGVKFDTKIKTRMEEIVANIPAIITLGNILIVIDSPKTHWNNRLLHSDKFPAIEWKDGTGVYCLNGVSFPKELWTEVVSGNMPFEKILSIEDIDQRTQAMRYGDVRQFLVHSKAQKLDSYEKMDVGGHTIKYELFLIPKGDIFTQDAFYMVYDCPSTKKVYMSGVETCKSVPEAMAWKQGITPALWKLQVPLVHES